MAKKLSYKLLSPALLVHSMFLLLLALSVFYCQERQVVDSGYYLFKVINNASFYAEHNRFILWFSQVLPWLGVNLGLSLKAVCYLYTLNHPLYFYTLYLLCHQVLKLKSAGPMLLLIQTLGMSGGFFVPMFELYYGAGLVVLLAAMLRSKVHIPAIAYLPVVFFAVLSHPFAMLLLLLPFGDTIVFQREKLRSKHGWILLFIAASAIFKLMTSGEYEQAKTSAFFQTLTHEIFDFQYVSSLVTFLIHHYADALLLVLSILVYALWVKQYRWLGFVLVTILTTVSIATVAHYGFDNSRYAQQNYFLLMATAAYFFAGIADRQTVLFRPIVLSTLAVCIVRVVVICDDANSYFTPRLMELKQAISETQRVAGTKFMVREASFKIDPNWSFPLESLLISGMDADGKQVTICTDYDMSYDNNAEVLTQDQFLFRRFDLMSLEDLNVEYFKLKHEDYKLL